MKDMVSRSHNFTLQKTLGQNNMFISHKSNVLQQFHETEWQCRRLVKGLDKPEYWAWEETIKDSDGVPDYSGETGYTIVECTDENVQERLTQLDDYINYKYREPGEALVYNIKYYASKKDAEEIKDVDGNSHDPKQYVQSHFVPDDSAKDARLLAEEWTRIRAERDSLLTETDWMTFADSPALSDDWKTYRQTLRDLPNAQKAKTTYDSITWPTKPS